MLKRINYIIIFIIIVWGYFWLLTGAYYAYPNAEDLSLAAYPKHFGLFSSVKTLLIDYDGRYFTNILQAISPLALGEVYYFPITILITILLSLTSCFFLLKIIFNGNMPIYKLLTVSSLFVLSHFTLIPSLPHSLYFAASSYVYLYGWIFFFFCIGFTILYFRAEFSLKKLILFFAAAIFLIFSIGINEMFLVLYPVLLILTLLYLLKKHPHKTFELLPLFIIGFTCIAFFISCPGPYKRAAQFNESRDFYFFIEITFLNIKTLFLYILEWFFKNPLSITFAAFISAYIINYLPKKIIAHFTLKNGFIAIAFIIAVLIMMSYAYYMPIGKQDVSSSRLYNFNHFIFQLIPFFILPAILVHYNNQISSKIKKHKDLIISIFLFISAFYVVNGNNNINLIKKEYHDGTLCTYNEEMKLRFKTIEMASKKDGWSVAEIDTLTFYPKIYNTGQEIGKNRHPDYWNKAYENYFGIDEIKFKNDTVEKLDLLEILIKDE